MTLVITKIVDIFLSSQTYFKDIPVIVGVLLLPVLFILPMVYIMIQTFYPLFDNNIDENLLKDYKEIIDEIVRAKIEQ